MSQQTQPLVSIDTLFDLFAHPRRRNALRVLHTDETPMPLADLADEVAVRENESHISDIPAEAVKRVYVSLYHTHIPKLADGDIARYDQEQDSVALGARSDAFEQYQELPTAD